MGLVPGAVPYTLSPTGATSGTSGSPLPAWQYLVAFNNNAFDAPTAITTVAPVGTVGAVNVWTDITQYVFQHQIQRGRQHELDRFEAGQLTLDLNDNTGVFDSWNAAGPYYGLLKVGKPVQVRATYNGVTYTRFTGTVQGWPSNWPDQFSQWKQITAYDAFRSFSNMTLQGPAYRNQVISDGASNYWRLSETDGFAVDIIGGQNGSYLGAGSRGVAGALPSDPNLAYDGGSYVGMVHLPPGAAVTSYPFTLEGWVNLHALPSAVTDADTLYSQANAAGTRQLALFLNQGAGVAELTGFIYDGTTANSVNVFLSGGSGGGGTQQWVYVSLSVDATGKAYNMWAQWLGGAAQASGSWTTAASLSGTNVRVGLLTNHNTSTDLPGANAAVDEFAIYRGTAFSLSRMSAHATLAWANMAQSNVGPGITMLRMLGAIGYQAQSLDTTDDNNQSMVMSVPTGVFTGDVLSTMQGFEVSADGALFMDTLGRARALRYP